MPDNHVNKIELIGAIIKHLDRKERVKTMLPREFNTIIRCATEIVEELAKPEQKVTAGMGLQAWLASDHTGVSSCFMASVLSERFCGREHGHPHDPDDFSRCAGLLIACPELRSNIPRLVDHGPEWKAIAENWTELESLWNEKSPSGKCPKLHARMKELGIE